MGMYVETRRNNFFFFLLIVNCGVSVLFTCEQEYQSTGVLRIYRNNTFEKMG